MGLDSVPSSRQTPRGIDQSGLNTILIAGVSGSGKTTVAALLADHLGWPVLDADLLHSAASIKKMASGTPLTDADRWPWLERLAEAVSGHSGGLVVACSALRQKYRSFLAVRIPELVFCMLEVSPHVASRRVQRRRGHFMAVSLLASQFADLEPLAPTEPGFSVDADQELATVVEEVVRGLEAASTGNDSVRQRRRTS